MLSALLTPSCAKKAGPGGHGGFQMPPTPVEVASVAPQVVRDQLHALGGLEAVDNIEVVSELNAKVTALPFSEGQPVARGAVLAVLDDRDLSAGFQRAQAQTEQAKSNFDRATKLSEQQMMSAQQLEDARTALRVAQANEALAKVQLDRTRIRAPWAGATGRRKVSPGAYVRSGDAITELARIDEMKVTFAAPERYLGAIHTGAPVMIQTPAFPAQSFVGHVTVVDPNVDPNTRTVQLIARVPNSERKLKPGMSANVTVTLAERGRALMVPDEAVFAEGSQSYVYVVKQDSTVARTAVELGARDSARVEVTTGLASGMTVVRTGHQKLFDGAHVVPVTNLGTMAAGAPNGGGK